MFIYTLHLNHYARRHVSPARIKLLGMLGSFPTYTPLQLLVLFGHDSIVHKLHQAVRGDTNLVQGKRVAQFFALDRQTRSWALGGTCLAGDTHATDEVGDLERGVRLNLAVCAWCCRLLAVIEDGVVGLYLRHLTESSKGALASLVPKYWRSSCN